ncbi:MAG TPA: hypothetical protein VLE21_01890 [Candidatus Nitrosocosmicus sp.]|nr:hypothetical protein [Candidatus Nitrosocosmicus sp.]
MSKNSDFSLSELSVKKEYKRERFSIEKLVTRISRAGTFFLIAKEIS